MIQDIAPSKIDIAYRSGCTPEKDSFVLHFKEGQTLVRRIREGRTERPEFPQYKDYKDAKDCQYMFSLDGRNYFLCLDEEVTVPEGFQYMDNREIRSGYGAENRIEGDCEAGGKSEEERWEELTRNRYKEIFVSCTAFHLNHWYRTSRYCGRCGSRMVYGKKERVMECPECRNMVYPRINPAVIVGVLSPDHKRLLITRYARSRGVKVEALVAGFTEIGETLEDTVRREVMEEVGLRVRNIRYYKSQPWGIADDVLAGFFCDAEEGQEIRLDEDELRSAVWQTREEIQGQPDNLSLTNEMMIYFREHEM